MSKSERFLHVATYEILRTKFAIPKSRSPSVVRTAQIAKIEQGIDGKLTIVSAPPGFGKTTLVTQWITGRSKQPGTLRFAWISLDNGDNDPVRFWRYVITAFQSFKPDIAAAALEMLSVPQTPAFEAALISIVNELTEVSGKNILVLEDYHVIQTRQVHETLSYLIDHMPANLHLVITTRSEPPLPLPRLRVRNELTELNTKDLRFSWAEIREFLLQNTNTTLDPQMIDRLEQRTEGWAAGLSLVALALEGLQERDEIERHIEALAGSNKHILDYLTSEIFNAQDEMIQDFLLRTSILSRLTGSICDALTGRVDSSTILEQIVKANLFLEPLDDAHNWYRYPALFAEAMQQKATSRLGREVIRSLYEQASCWFEEHGYLGNAVEAALSAQSFSRAKKLIEQMIQESPGLANEIHTLRRWLESFPTDELQKSALLCFTFAVAILYTSDRYAPETRALLEVPSQTAERLWRAENNNDMIGRVIAFRSLVDWWQGDYQSSFARVKEALELLSMHDAEWRGTCMLGKGIEVLLTGETISARQNLLEAHELFESSGNSFGVLAAKQILGLLYLKQGYLHQANELFQEVLKQGANDLSDRAQALSGMAEIAYQWNELERAKELASEALEISRQVREHDAIVSSSITLVRTLIAQRESEHANHLVYELATHVHGSILAGDKELSQAWIEFKKGDLGAAAHWVAKWDQDANLPLLVQEQRSLLAIRLQIARGDFEETLQHLEPWLVKAHKQGRMSSEIEILILQSLAWAGNQDQIRARQCLLQALSLAEPEGIKRVFLDEGDKLALLIKDILPELQPGSLAAFARALLISSVGQKAEKSTVQGDIWLMDPLSEAEMRVLRLLLADRTYREIAEEQVVSLNTVKTQVKSIYSKLGVSSRDEARNVARHLKMKWAA